MVLWKSLEPPTIFFYMYTSSYFTSKTGSFSNFFPKVILSFCSPDFLKV